ncbi:hypothetical protein BX616_000121 [Lobosporangium transversale]|uniref:Major facilitator superfamily domain-containing protein n=1 Tax=Lobosporangium transversale TaxID=64571 RepID=A0A1Y2GKH3_9FUNG|nr:major facilitator superfamily domain-containing protein [Lobosporangium transversale]KAF9908520.1 hypothetical protein BX616_000121 [Lobosporangium transversale]ORZ13857.1 major facilitator superfamily domain-containing protein [Lobosporangium transversale]|eukprot:XP_021880641.1 major facilitator superfamily domain-containing protein [Lobosporangium transversale]
MTSISTVDNKSQLPWYRRLNQMKALLLATMSMAQMLDIINVAGVTITLPDIMRDVGYKVDQLQWVTSAYALAYGAFLLIGGRLGDLFGHRRIYILGVAWFSIWALVNGFAKDPIVMSVGRALQGMGAGFTIPSALAILTTTYPVGPERTQALAVFGGTGAIGSVIGVLLGGILGSTIGWRWIFFFTAILGSILAALGFLVIPAEKDISTIEDRRVDIMGILSFTFGIVAVIYYLSESPAKGWSSASTLPPLCVGIALLIAFVVLEWKIDYPIMPLHIWRSQRLVASCLTVMALTASINALIFFSSLTFQNVQGYSTMKTSLCYIVHGVGAIVTIVILTKLVTFVRTKIIMVVGWLVFIASGILFAQIKADSSYWSIAFPALILNFLGMAPVWLCCQINSVADAKNEDQGVVGAVYNVALQIGVPLGVAISNVIANSRNAPDARGLQLLPGYKAAFYSYTVMGGIGLILTILLAANSDPIRALGGNLTETTSVSAEADEEQLRPEGSEVIDHSRNKDVGTRDQSETFEETKIGSGAKINGNSGLASAGATTIFQGSSASSLNEKTG